MAEQLTLMAVHAHPDDEAIGTGGVLARAASEGIRTVLVTCTNGELGDAPGGIKPGLDGHTGEEVAVVRKRELEQACKALGVSHLEMLGYHDSGMMGWDQNSAPHAFWNTPVEEAAKKLAALFEQHRPDVVVTYDENGFYGHPDHIQANRITLAATEMTGIPRKVYYTAVARSAVEALMQAVKSGDLPFDEDFAQWDPDAPPFGVPDELITTVVDVAMFTPAKRAAIAAHASQSENIWMLKLGDEVFDFIFGKESFTRHADSTGAPTPEEDLFAGLR